MQIGQDFLDIIQIVHLIRMLPFRKQLQAIWKTEKKKKSDGTCGMTLHNTLYTTYQ